MKYIHSYKKSAVSICLAFSQLLTFQSALASSEELTLDDPSQISFAPLKKKQTSKYKKLLIFEQPDGGEIQVNASGGYVAAKADVSYLSGYNMPQKSQSENTGLSSKLSAAYGITDNFYSKLTLGYSNTKNTMSTTSYGSVYANPDVVSTSDGIKEPNVLIGAHMRLGSTQLFAELNADVAIGDRVTKKNSEFDYTDNNLKGGMTYSSSFGAVHDLGNILLMGGLSYTFKDERTKKQEAYGFTNRTDKETGGNLLDITAGLELKNLLRWGFLLGYERAESREIRTVETYQVSVVPERSYAAASTYLGIEVGSNIYLIPQLTYATTLDKNVSSNFSQADINQEDSWNMNLGARVSF